MEEFNFSELTLDEAAEARIAHAEFLNSIKDWGLHLGKLLEPYTHVANILLQDEIAEEELEKISIVFPLGLKLTIEHVNEFYNLMQVEAKKVLGAPFALHDAHSPYCDGTRDMCGHQDHWA